MADHSKDVAILRGLAKKYAEIAHKPVQEEKRKLWSAHNALQKTRVPVVATFGTWNIWCQELLADKNLQCTDPFFRDYEKFFKVNFIQDGIGDDLVIEPWITLAATRIEGDWDNHWGLKRRMTLPEEQGGAFHQDAMIQDWSEVGKLRGMKHGFDEVDTRRRYDRLAEAVGDIIAIDVSREPVYYTFTGDISTDMANIRGLQQMMMDMYEYPQELHKLLAFMRDAILKNQKEAEDAGHYTLTCGRNQEPVYADGLPRPKPNSQSVKRKDLQAFYAAQEFTLVSPEFHEEFLLQYQMPIMANFGMVHYGCCEDLTRKIDILRKVKNLRRIAIAPSADYRRCAEQIGKDYVCSYRPNPTDMVSSTWDEDRIKRIMTDARDAFKNCIWHVHLKDIETFQGDFSRFRKCIQLVKEVVNGHY